MSEQPIHVLLATYDGARHLDAQLRSLLGQREEQWVCLARDDGSRDGTQALLAAAARADARIRIVEDGLGRLGPTASFSRLMTLARDAGAEAFALCDQDDVWAPDKLVRQRVALDRMAAQAGASVPALVYSDLRWVAADGRELADSHFTRAGLAPARTGVGHWLLAMNAIPGCVMAGNRALLELAAPVPPGVAHHDWWLALVAAACGEVVAIPEALVDYRQHGANAIGARSLGARVSDAVRMPADTLATGRTTYWQGAALARALEERAAGRMHPSWRSACRHALDGLAASARWRRVASVVRGPVRRVGAFRNALMLAAAALPPPSGSLLE